MSANPYAPPRARIGPYVAPGAALELWNPSATLWWSFLSSPAFGAYLQMKNWQALGEPERASASWQWAASTATLILLLSLGSFFMPESRPIGAAARAVGLPLVVVWVAASGRQQVQFVKERHSGDYLRKGWGIPLLIMFLGLLGVGVVAGGLSLLMAM